MTARFFGEVLSVEAPALARAIMGDSAWAAPGSADALTG
jgi:hypothetical protein